MKRVTWVMCCVAGLLPLTGLAAATTVIGASAVETRATATVDYHVDTPTTLRQLSRGWYPASGAVRTRFIRSVAVANPDVFASIAMSFDQPLPAGQRLQIPTALLPAGLPSARVDADTPVLVARSVQAEPVSGKQEAPVQRISIKSFAAQVVKSDELVKVQYLEEKIADESVRGAKGIYEPFVFASLEREAMDVQTTAQEKLQQGNRENTFQSQENRVKTGVVVKAPTGADVELSYNIMEMKNSLQPIANRPTPEYKGYVGFKLNQPLLRGAGVAATEAGIAIAETDKLVATETVRQIKAQRVMESLQAYIFVQRAEERVRLRKLAYEVATEIEREMTRQNATGFRSAADLTEARSSLALRRSQLAQARQDLEEQQNTLQIFVSARERDANTPLTDSRLRPADPLAAPKVSPRKLSSNALDNSESLNKVMDLRPEARVNAVRIEREGRKLAAAHEQTLPEMNFTARYGKESLTAERQQFGEYFGSNTPYYSWMVGLTLKVGLFGDEKKDSEFKMARYRKHQAELALGAVRQRIANEVQASGVVLEQAMQQVDRQTEIVEAQHKLLNIERDLFKEGRRSSLDVLKKQLESLLAEESLADSLVYATRASYLAAQVEGTLLSQLGLE